MEAARELADLADRERELLLGPLQELRRTVAAARHPSRCDAKRLEGDDQPLLRAVVEVPLEPPPLRVAGTHEPIVRGAKLALRLPELGRVPHDRHDLVVVDRHHPGLELAPVAADRRQHVAERLQLARLERLPDRRHEGLGDLRRQQVFHPAADDVLPRIGEELGVADEVDVDAVGRDAEHQVGDGVEQGAHARLDVRSRGSQVVLLHRPSVPPGVSCLRARRRCRRARERRRRRCGS